MSGALDLSTKTIKIFRYAFDATARNSIAAHLADNDNPHDVTAAQLGLGSVDNTPDADKPISDATQAALDLKADLDSPALTGTPTAPTASTGDVTTKIATTANAQAKVNVLGAVVTALDATVDAHIANTNNPHAVTAADVGLGEVDNTADTDKPVSTLQQAAINAVAADVATVAADLATHEGRTDNPHAVTAEDVGLGNVDDTPDLDKPISNLTQAALNTKAPINSPSFTGVPEAPTADPGTDTEQIATTEFVTDAAATVAATAASALAAHTGNVSNPHAVTKAQVGLALVDNTPDSGKPVSTAQAAAIAAVQAVADAAQADADTALDQSLQVSSLVGSIGRERPGDAVRLFRTTLTGEIGITDLVPPAWVVNTTAAGRLVRVDAEAEGATDPQIIAPVAAFPLEDGRVYEFRWKVKRVTDPADPLNDSVSLKIKWLDGNKASTGTDTTVEDIPLEVADGLQERAVRVATAAADGVQHVAPAGAMYARPYFELFGGDHVTDIVVLERSDVTAAFQTRGADLNLVYDFGADPTGTLDATAACTAAITYLGSVAVGGGKLRVPRGRYRIAGAGADAGGVIATIRRSVLIDCDAGAEFFTDPDDEGIDNDFFRISVPSNGADLPATGIDFEWRGGLLDMSNMFNSEVVPFVAEIPPIRLGASSTCDGLSIRGEYNSGQNNGLRRVEISGLTVYAGPHWNLAGGDSGVFVNGAELIHIHDSKFTGCRDLGIYLSAGNHVSAGAVGRFNIHHCLFINCFGGASHKRSARSSSISFNEFNNCVLGAFLGWGVGDGPRDTAISFNTFYGCKNHVRVDHGRAITIEGNNGSNWGSLMDDGVTITEDTYSDAAYMLKGCEHCTVIDNKTLSVNALYAAENPAHVRLEFDDEDNPCLYNEIIKNKSDGFHTAGIEVDGEADFNALIQNYEFSGSVKNFQPDGANTYEERFDWTLGRKVQRSPMLLNDGADGAPILGRASAPSQGYDIANGQAILREVRLVRYVQTGIGAAGTTQADASALSRDITSITAGDAGTGVRLMTSVAGYAGMFLDNQTGTDKVLYPEVGARINALADNAGFTIPAGQAVIIFCRIATRWRVFLL